MAIAGFEACFQASHQKEIEGDHRVVGRADIDHAAALALGHEFGVTDGENSAVGDVDTKGLEGLCLVNSLDLLNGHVGNYISTRRQRNGNYSDQE
jgi:hypothetical protein